MSSSSAAAGERYNLRWNNFFNNLVQVFSDLKHKEQLVDVTLICEGQHIKAHKIVLAACSDFFMDLFKNTNHVHPVIKFYDMQVSNLKHIIQFIYQGEVKVLDVDLEGVLNLGEKFQVKGLSSVKLKHQVGPTGECIAPESVRYKVLSQTSSNKDATTMSSILNANVSISDLVDNTSEPFKKKAKIQDVTNEQSEKAVPKSIEKNLDVINISNNLTSTSTKPVSKSVSLLKSNVQMSSISSEQTHSTWSTTNIKNYSKASSKEQGTIEKPQPLINVKHFSTLNQNNGNTILNKEQPKEEALDQHTSDTSKEGNDKPNAFIIFSREWRKKLKVEYPSEDFKSISVRLGNLWKSLTSETRESYYTAARQAQLSISQTKSEL